MGEAIIGKDSEPKTCPTSDNMLIDGVVLGDLGLHYHRTWSCRIWEEVMSRNSVYNAGTIMSRLWYISWNSQAMSPYLVPNCISHLDSEVYPLFCFRHNPLIE